MAYIGAVTYDDGGRIRSLDGLAAVTYDSGRTRNLLGAELGAVKYDDGGRFRTLVGMGQDLPPDMPPPDVGIDESIGAQAFPISYTPPSIAPSFVPFIPSPVVDLTSAPITGTLAPPPAPPASAGTLVSVLPPVASALTSILNSVRNVFSGSPTAVKPVVAGTVAPAGTVGASWFSQGTMVSGLPNWGVLAGVGIAGVVLVAAMRGGGHSASPRRRNPAKQFEHRRAQTRKDLARFIRQHPKASRREIISKFPGYRRNPAELILMGANPSRRAWGY